MGCDIHMHVEYKRTVSGNERWICADYFRPNPYWNGIDEDESKYALIGFCDNRNYDLFATLANVRNYGKTDFIDEPRGLPEDVTAEVKADSDSWGMDGHSHSYMTLQELIDFHEEGHQLKQSGMISFEDSVKLATYGTIPTEWCQWTNARGWVKREWSVENNILVPLIDALKARADELYFIYNFLWESRPEEAYKKAANIRIVFWFDN